VLSQDDGTSSSDCPAIECPKAGNVRKTRQCARIDRPTRAAAAPEAAVPARSTAGHPGHKVWQMPATAQQAPHPQADDSFAADDLLDRVAQRDFAWKALPSDHPAAASHSPPKTNSGTAAAGAGRSMRALSRLADVAGFWTLDRTTITGRSADILRQHTTPFRPMIVPFDDLELVYQSLRNSSRHIRANFRASMCRSPDWAPFNLET
jgi:hypothetical protein